MRDPLLALSATRLARMIVRREVSAREVVEAHIKRVEEVNPKIRAMVEDRFALARFEADQADKTLRGTCKDNLPPFLGVPCTVKEAIALRGMPFTAGHVHRLGVLAEKDATATARLRKAGFIPIGVSNTSELCMWMESYNKVYGRTSNPYDYSRTAGGSSGGEGALVGAGCSPVGLGADIGGSIRMPAFFNGVFGHKPTGGLIPNTGNYPLAFGKALRYMTTGPLVRRAEDLWPVLKILAGPDGEDEGCSNIELGDPAEVNIASLRVLVVEDNEIFPVHEVLRATLWRAAKHLATLGAEVSSVRVKALRDSILIWSCTLQEAGGPTYAGRLGNGTSVGAVKAVLQHMLGLSPYTLPSVGLVVIERFLSWMRVGCRSYVELGKRLCAELSQRLGQNGVLLFPPYPEPAPPHNRPIAVPFRWIYTGIFNVLEMPATAVPMGLGSDGLPLGVQVVAAHGNDHLCVAVAMELERAFGGWQPPVDLA